MLQRILLASLIPISILGCASVKTVTKQQLAQLAIRNAKTSFPESVYYCGSTEGYDYFVIVSAIDESPQRFKNGHRYRINSAEQSVSQQFQFTQDTTQWRDYRVQ